MVSLFAQVGMIPSTEAEKVQSYLTEFLGIIYFYCLPSGAEWW